MNDALIAVDYALLGVVALSAMGGLFRGFVKEALSLAVWVLAIWCAWRFGAAVSNHLLPDLIADPVLKLWATRLIVLVAVLIGGGLVTWLISGLIDRTGLTGTDRMLGMVFGVARGAILAAMLVIGLQFTGFDQDPWWQESKLIPYAAPIADTLRNVAAEGLEIVDGSAPDAADEPAIVVEPG